MSKAINPKPQRSAKGGTAGKRGPTPTHQDGVLGAGSASALVIIASYAIGKDLPAQVVAATAPFISFAFTYLVARAKHYQGVRRERTEEKDYQLAVKQLLEDPDVDEETKNMVRAKQQEAQLLSIEAKRRKVVARLEESISGANTSGSEG